MSDSMTAAEQDAQPVEKIEKTDIGYRLSISSTRGTGTRDEDTVKAQARAETMEAIEAQREDLREQVITTMNELRANQPDADNE